ncbi:MAG: hypothetical protein L0387_45550 [Acidobacteria bacterium]|nr:hypothetical protein [Acidobacteriota bacterium]
MSEVNVQESRKTVKVMGFNEINEPGSYVMLSTGDLVRVPPEAVAPGHSPLITVHSRGTTRVAQLSTNDAELITTLRHIAADNDIQPNF